PDTLTAPMDILRMPLDSITADAIENFCMRNPTESAQLELKGGVPDDSHNPSPWTSVNTRLSKFAKQRLLKEIVALANSYGGLLILGIDEDDERRASSVSPVPACSRLEKTIEDVIRDSVDPQINGIEMRTVPFPEGSDEGVLIIRIPQSR